MTVSHKLFKILSGHGFCIKCYRDLDFDRKMYRGRLLTMTNPIPSRMTVTYKRFKILSGHGFCMNATVTLTFDLKIDQGQLLTMTNLPPK